MPSDTAFSAIPMVDAPPMARPATVTAVIIALFFPLYNKNASPSFFCFFEIITLIAISTPMYTSTIISGIIVALLFIFTPSMQNNPTLQ